MPNPNRPILLLLDWDSTLTTTSTLPLIASIATLPLIHPSLPALTAAYTADLKRHDDTYIPAKRDRTSIDQELIYLSSLSAVEKASVERLEAAGIFKDVGANDIDVAAAACWDRESVTLPSGWRRMVESVLRRGKVGIVSVAWSRRFIEQVLREADRAAGGEGGVGDEVAVVANDISGDGSGGLDRWFGGKRVWSAADKGAVMGEFVGEFASRSDGSGVGERPVVVYIGDSVTDLMCLVQADIGICIRDEVLTGEQEALREVLVRVGVECFSIKEFSRGLDGLDGGGRRLWSAMDFEEVFESGVFDGVLDGVGVS